MKNYILNFLSIILGFVYIFFVLWNRIIRERLPRDLTGMYNIYIYCIYCILFLISLILFLYYMKKILNIKSNYSFVLFMLKNKYVQNILEFLLEYVCKAPYKSYILIYNKVNLLPLVEKIGVYIWDRDPYKDPCKIYIFCCFCRLFVLASFFIDVFIFHKFNYFYKSLIMLLFYLICNCTMFILKDVSYDNRKYITDNFITVANSYISDGFIIDFKETYDGDRSDEMLHNHYNVWICYLANCMFTDKYYEYVDKYNKYINFIYYGIFSCGWAYILYNTTTIIF